MKVLSAEFVTSAADARGIPRDPLPQIALVGRSNVGKSTLINALAGRTIAHTSAKPGKTRLANLYRLHVQGGRADASGALASWRFYLVDLPGYGYATGGKAALEQFAAVTEAYFSGASPRGPREGPEGSAEGAPERERAGVPPMPGLRRASPKQSEGGGPRERWKMPARAVLQIVDARHPGLDADLAARTWIDTLGVPVRIVATKMDKLSRSARARAAREIERHLNAPVLPVSADTGEGLDDLWTHIVKLASR